MRASVPLKHVEKKMWMSATEWSLEAWWQEICAKKADFLSFFLNFLNFFSIFF